MVPSPNFLLIVFLGWTVPASIAGLYYHAYFWDNPDREASNREMDVFVAAHLFDVSTVFEPERYGVTSGPGSGAERPSHLSAATTVALPEPKGEACVTVWGANGPENRRCTPCLN